MVSTDGVVGQDAVQLWAIFNGMPMVLYWLGEVSSFWLIWGHN